MTSHFPAAASDISAEASAWIAQLESGELTAADRDAFAEWIARSPRHAAEVRHLAELSLDLNVLTGMAQPLRRAARQHRPDGRHAVRRVPPAMAQAAAGVLLLVAIVVTVLLLPPVGRPVGEPRIAATTIGEQRQITLPDDTVVLLNTDSRIEVAYDRRERKVRLLKGEGFFKVAHDEHWPFVVYAGDNIVRAVGTSFAISMVDQDVEVTVTEGRVKLTKLARLPGGAVNRAPQTSIDGEDAAVATSTAIMLDAGQSVALGLAEESGPIINHSHRELERELAWREGLLEFSDTPLEDVVAQINRYSTLAVEISDPALLQVRFGGIFRIGDMQQLLDTLQASYDIAVIDLGDHRVGLGRKSTAGAHSGTVDSQPERPDRRESG